MANKPDEEMIPPALFLKLGDRDEIKMTYGLEMDLRRMLPDPQSAMVLIMSDPGTQDYIVRRVMTRESRIITDVDELIASGEIDLNSEEVEQILMWVLEHALYFFVRRTKGMRPLAEKFQAALPEPTPNGSSASPSTTPSVGLLGATNPTSTE